MEYEKPLRFWTIEEIVRFCSDHRNTCLECPACKGDDVDDCIFKEPAWTLKDHL